MSKRGRDLSDDEEQLWRRVVARVKPRKKAAKASVETKQLEPSPGRAPQPVEPAPQRARSAPSAPSSPAPNRGNEKRVRRGKLEIGATLDLHGHTQESAQSALSRFLRAAHRRGDRTVIVITGVGRAGPGVLRQRLPEWLAQREVRALVSGFAQAHRAHGGAGAYYVFLKNNAG